MASIATASAAAYSRQLFGAATVIRVSRPVVGTTVAAVLDQNPNRVQAFVSNLTVNDVIIGFDREVTTVSGFRIGALGGQFRLIVFEDGELVAYPVFGVASAGSNTLYVVEVITLPGRE